MGRVMTVIHKEMQDYFSHYGFRRLFGEISKKYRSLGKVGGMVKLGGLSPEELDRLSGFLGRDCRDSDPVVVRLSEINEILKQSRFEIDLPEFLHFYFGEEMVSNKDIAAAESQKWADFFTGMSGRCKTEVARGWLRELAAGKGAGYRTVLSIYRQNSREAEDLLGLCAESLDWLVQNKGRRLRLPVFAACLTGDPHSMDMDKPLGRLLFYGLHHMFQHPETEYLAERRKVLFSRAGLYEDDISSNVIVAGLKVVPGDPREALFASSARAASPLLLPLRFLEQPTGWMSGDVYVLENPAVFSTILDCLEGCPDIPTLVCTSGQPSVAALQLLDQLAMAGCAIYYGGDFDPKGLEMGQRLALRYGSIFHPFFFDTESYLKAPKGVKLTPGQAKRLSRQEIEWDKKLIENMLQVGLAVYQEVLAEKIIKFFNIDCR
ncbi:MAG: TIGR02679 family protein [Bacillota bacterium]